jgi:hypothetical protein
MRARLCVLALLALALSWPVPAQAGRVQQTIFDAGSALLNANAGQRANRLDQIQRLGVDTVRLVLQWRSFAPSPGRSSKPGGFDASDPADYPRGPFASLDATVRGARARGMDVLLTPSSPIPNWASVSGRSRLSNPKPGEFRRFVGALGRRYRGSYAPPPDPPCEPTPLAPCDPPPPLPRIRFWSVWNEPNQDLFLRPQRRGGKPYSPRLYRRLFEAAQAGLRSSGHGNDRLLLGETAPSGGRSGVDPIDFMRGVLCLDRRYRPKRPCPRLEAGGWAHHPYSLGLAPFERSPNPGLINLARIGRFTAALDRARRAGALSGDQDLFVTEYGVPTVPDREFGVGLRRQVVQLAISEFLAWRSRDVRSYAQYLLFDDPPEFEFSFTTGLRRNGGRAKPAYRSFPLTLLVRRRGSRGVAIWGHVRPADERVRVTVSYRDRGRERRLRRVRTNRRGYFSFRARHRPGRRWRAESRLPNGRLLKGVYVEAVRF